MPRPGSKIEKSKDFKGSIKKILKSLGPWHIVILVSIMLAASSAVISLIAPNKLSDLTNYVTEGLKPNINENTFTEIMSDTSISMEDKNAFISLMNVDDKESSQQDMLKKMDELPRPIYKKIEPKMDMDMIKKLSLLLAILYIVSSLFSYIQQLIMAHVTNNYGKMHL